MIRRLPRRGEFALPLYDALPSLSRTVSNTREWEIEFEEAEVGEVFVRANLGPGRVVHYRRSGLRAVERTGTIGDATAPTVSFSRKSSTAPSAGLAGLVFGPDLKQE